MLSFLNVPFVLFLATSTTTAFTTPPPKSSYGWSPSSWRNVPKKSKIIPVYQNKKRLQSVLRQLNQSAPLIFAEEARTLQDELAQACVGQSFVLIGGDCAETFEDSNVMKLWHDFSLLVQLAFLLTFGLEMPIVKIGRMCGQYAKPRSDVIETVGNVSLASYQGDIINAPGFSEKERDPNPFRMLEAYHKSVQSINILRAFIQGGYTDIYNHESWSYFYTIGGTIGSVYNDILSQLKRSLRFMNALQISSDKNKYLKDVSFFIGHEALLLPYEECLVRNDSLTNTMYDCSAHFLWIGERTRELDGAHIEFCRGIQNPIGVKISEKMTPTELLNLTYILNPDNIPGRLTLVTRMGTQNLKTYLPDYITVLKNNSRHVVWVCDPMHANTQIAQEKMQKYKTRYFRDIWNEIQTFFEIHWAMGSVPAGIHLEMTGQNVTECLGGYADPVVDFSHYKTAMDPRLNPTQTMEVMLLLCQLFDSRRNEKEAVDRTLFKE